MVLPLASDGKTVDALLALFDETDAEMDQMLFEAGAVCRAEPIG